MSWEKVNLGDAATFVNGYPFKPSDWNGSGLSIIRIQDLTGNSYETNYFGGIIPEKYKVKDGDLLISWSASLGVYEWHRGEAWLNQHIFKVVFDKLEWDKNFFKHLISFKVNEMEKQVHGATMKHITKGKFDNIPIPYPPLPIQRKIAAILDQADALRKKDQQLLAKYDELLQAVFYDMFGDPVRNEKGWEVKTIEELVKNEKYSIKRGPFGGALKKEIFVPKGFLVYEQFHALNNDFSFERYYINDKKFEELKAFEVKPGDIIVSCSGIYLGKLAIVPDNAKKGIINQALLKISLDNKIISNHFFVQLFTKESFREKFFGDTRGSGIPNFPPMEEFREFKFIYPPKELQNKFDLLYQNIKQQKEQAKQQLQQSEALFQSLLQRAFKGELVKE